ncbi:MAG: hypothetical protein ACLR8Y_02430 [Alistipes indistinctus]
MGEGVMTLLRDMSPEEIFRNYARHIGIGGIAMAGVVGRYSSWFVEDYSAGAAGVGRQRTQREVWRRRRPERTQRDPPMKLILTVLDRYAARLLLYIFPVRGAGTIGSRREHWRS